MTDEQQSWLPPKPPPAKGPEAPTTPAPDASAPGPTGQTAGPPTWPPPPGGYGQQPGPGAGFPPLPPPTFVQAPPSNGTAVAALILGIAGIVLFFVAGFGLFFFLNLPCSIMAWVFGVQGKRKVDRGQTREHRGLAQAGVVLGVIGVVLGILGIVGWVLLFVLVGSADLIDPSPDLDGPRFDAIRLVAQLLG